MKKIFTLLFAAAVLAACSDNDHETPAPTFTVDVASSETFAYGETRTFAVTLNDAEGIEIIVSPTGWEIVLGTDGLSITAPARSEGERTGEIKLQAHNGGNASEPVTFTVEAFYIFDFESVPAEYLAVDTYGSNLYDGYSGQQYTGYTDEATSLTFSIIDLTDYYMAFNFYNGGTAISQWNDMAADGYMNQCSAYYSDATTGFGGNNGSETFGVVFDGSGMMGVKPSVVLGDESETVFDHIWVMNSTYAVLSMKNGDSAKQFSYTNHDWFLLTIEGFNTNGTSTGTVETYLADFKTSSGGGILTAWKKIDLSSLGAINSIEFSMSSSDVGDWGMNTPAYFCIDDIAIQ